MSTYDSRRSFEEAIPHARRGMEIVSGIIDTMDGPVKVQSHVMGSVRRAAVGDRTSVGDIDLLVTAQTDLLMPGVLGELGLPDWMTVKNVKAYGWLQGDGLDGRMMLDCWWCPWESVGPFALFLTGPMHLNVAMRRVTQQRSNLMLTQYGLFEKVAKPTKMYPDRTVAGDRVDDPSPLDVTVIDAEIRFWDQWCDAMQIKVPYPYPQDRQRAGRWISEAAGA